MELRSKHVATQLALLSVAVAMVVGGVDVSGRSVVGGGSFEVYAAKKSLAKLLDQFAEAVKDVKPGVQVLRGGFSGGVLEFSIYGLDVVCRQDFGGLGVDDDYCVDRCLVVGRVLNLPPPLV